MKKIKPICMAKLFFIAAFLFAFQSIKAQDTLVFKNGSTQIGKIFSFDESLGIIGYALNGDSLFVSTTALSSYPQKTNLNSVTQITDPSQVDIINTEIKPKLFRRQSQFDYGKLSFGINLLAPFTAIDIGFRVSSNLNFAGKVNYEMHKVFDLEFSFRGGLNYTAPPSDTLVGSYFTFRHYSETIFEVGLSPTLVLGRDRLISFYAKGEYHFGMNRSYEKTYFKDYYNFVEDPESYSYQDYDDFQLFTSTKRAYYRLGGAIGIIINAYKNLSIGLDIGLYGSSNRKTAYRYYENNLIDPTYYYTSGLIQNQNEIFVNGSVNLIIRIKSKVIEAPTQ